jgi:hypothetical protein
VAKKGLFNKVKNKLTRLRFVISTIRKDQDHFETAVFAANFFYIPRSLKQPDLTLETSTPKEAWTLHYRLMARFLTEHPVRIIQEYQENPSLASPQD